MKSTTQKKIEDVAKTGKKVGLTLTGLATILLAWFGRK